MTAGRQRGKRAEGAAPAERAALERPSLERHVYGPRQIGALVPALTRPAFRKRAPGGAQVMADWAQIVGPELSGVTTPRRLSGGTLTLACAGPVALELQHLADQLLARVNGYLGRAAVQRLRFVQDPQAPPPAVRQAARPLVAIELPGIPPGPLHDALTALGQRLGADQA